ncbi:MAG: U32 family peptidase [Blautia sp.]|nr:U32 family peptidase [Blautia sp.]
MNKVVTEQSRKVELLVPAGSLEVLKIAVVFGADAVYIGGDAFGLRAKAKNFSPQEMAEGIAFAHAHGVKVYVTVNIIAHNEDLPGVRDYLAQLGEIKPDALIIADPGIFSLAREICPELDIHISTQANNTNYETAMFWQRLGAVRIVTGRELSLEEIRTMRMHLGEQMQIETFVHGAMCISYSGRCLLSSFLAGRDANRGSCSHPCRWKYYVMEETRPGEYMPVLENERGTFLFNSKDLCMIDHLDDLMEAGIDSFKIEGRMKTALYVASVTRAYRHAIDEWIRDPESYRAHKAQYLAQAAACTHRSFTTGFFYGRPDQESQIYEESTYIREAVYLGYAQTDAQDGWFRLTQKNKFCTGDEIELMRPDGSDLAAKVLGIRDLEGNDMSSAPHARQELWIRLDIPAARYDILKMPSGDAKERNCSAFVPHTCQGTPAVSQ